MQKQEREQEQAHPASARLHLRLRPGMQHREQEQAFSAYAAIAAAIATGTWRAYLGAAEGMVILKNLHLNSGAFARRHMEIKCAL